MRCARCGEATDSDPCAVCGQPALLDGRYRLDALVSEGAFGALFRGTRLSDGIGVAIKEIPLRYRDGARTQQLVTREARVLQELSHPQIPRFVDSFTVGEGRGRAAFIVQQFVRGEDLASKVKRYSVDEVLDIVEELLPILGYLHTRSPPVIHRDLKPANVIRSENGRLFLVDFGAVRDALRDAQLGGSTVAGTFGFMAPEQLVGDASPQSDLYSLGALAIALLTRKEPKTLLDHEQSMQWRSHAIVPEPVAAVLDALLSPNPSERPASAKDTQIRLQAARRGVPQLPETTTDSSLVASQNSLRRFALGVAASVGIAVIVAVINLTLLFIAMFVS
ncbi:MAG: serine/threonine-protein kinase [Myxococcota bacterium]